MNPVIITLLAAVAALPLAGQQTAAAPGTQEITVRRFKSLGVEAQLTKTADPVTGAVVATAMSPDGATLDLAALESAERALRAERSPIEKIHPLLAERLAEVGPRSVRVGIWFRTSFDDAALRRNVDELVAAGATVEEARAVMRAEVAAANTANLEPAQTALLAAGFPVLRADTYAPVIFVLATAAGIDELATWPTVDTLYPSLTYEPELQNAVATHRWHRVHDFGIRGDGSRVAVIENNGIDDDHPALNVVGFYNAANHNEDEHPTAVAGIIGSDDATFPGHARGVQILSGNANTWDDPDLMGAASWAVGQGADVLNMSFGVDTDLVPALLDRYVDYMVRATATTICKSAGNRGGIDDDCTSPGLGWNPMTVGNVSDQENGDWDDDVMRASSSFGNPTTGCEKPELSASGTTITSSALGGGFANQGSGTSFSAPAIAGMAAALMQGAPTLRSWPEAVKAIFMAAATHNVEGASRLSGVDGAGAINGLQAYRMVEKGQYTLGSFSPSSFSTNGYWTYNITLRAGDLTRVVLAWDSLATSDYTSDVLNADLDLAIFQGSNVTSGTGLAFSSSFNNAFEIVEFCPPVTGTYTIRVNDFRFDGTSEFYGIGWTQHADGRYARFRPWLPDVTTTDLTGPAIGNQFFWIDPIDDINPGHTFLSFASFGTSVGFDLGGCRRNLGDFDPLTQFSLTAGNGLFLGNTGTLSSSGSWFSARIAVPDLPSFVGFPLFLNYITVDPVAPSGVKELGVVERVVFQSHATNQPVGIDGSAQVGIGFSFPFYGGVYTQCFVNANGNVTFGTGNSDFTESPAELLSGPPRIAAFWDDLNVNLGGVIRTRTAGSSQFIVEWSDVREFGATTGANSAMMVLHSDGRIDIKYRDCSLQDALVGISPGNGATGTEIDLDHGFRDVNGAVYEEFTGAGDAFDLGIQSSYRNTLTFTRRSSSTYRVTLARD